MMMLPPSRDRATYPEGPATRNLFTDDTSIELSSSPRLVFLPSDSISTSSQTNPTAVPVGVPTDLTMCPSSVIA